jgi:hypothetical protein
MARIERKGTREVGWKATVFGAVLFLATAAPVKAQECVGDCNDDGEVTIDELLVMVNIALGTAGLDDCTAGDGNGDGEVTIDEILLAVNAALEGCGPRPTPTPGTMTPTPPVVCEAPTPRPTPPPPANCGNGVIDEGETCDDGNTVEDEQATGTQVDRCPSNCRIASCLGAQTTLDVDIDLCVPQGAEVGGVTLLLRYPDGVVGVPGSGNSDLVLSRMIDVPEDPFVSLTANDLDYALRAVAFSVDLLPIPAGRLVTVRFDRCPQAAAPAVEDFRCVVKDAASPSGALIDGVTCSVRIR